MRFAGSNTQVAKFMGQSPRYDEQATAFSDGRTMERNYVTAGEQIAASAGIDALGMIRESEEKARGIVAQGEAAGSAAQAQGMSGMMSGIAKGIGGLKLG